MNDLSTTTYKITIRYVLGIKNIQETFDDLETAFFVAQGVANIHGCDVIVRKETLYEKVVKAHLSV